MKFTLGEYLRSIQKKSVAVVGIGISNTPLIRRLLTAGIAVTACDKKERDALGGLAAELEAMGAKLSLGQGYLENLNCDIIFRSPGIRPDIAPFQEAIAQGSRLTSEMEVFFQVCPSKIIAVTGSDGKTTTTTLISELLKNAGYRVHVGGNIGNPLLVETEEMQPEDMVVLELSSFQLMTLDSSPQIAVVTNLSPNHLDIHTDMAEYRGAKENIFLHQGPEDLAIFNADNEETLAYAQKAKGKKTLFSRSPLEEGVYVKDGVIYVSREGKTEPVLETTDILIPGQHNVENYLAAIAATWGLVPREVIVQTAKTFPGVEHRIELIRTLNDVRYYNDSIASSPTRTIAGLRSFQQKVILMAGGYDKKIPFAEMGEEICRRVKTVVLTGATAPQIQEAILSAEAYREARPEIIMVPDFKEAALAAHRAAKPGDVVILSPACASFDHFENFAQRGRTFKEIIREL